MMYIKRIAGTAFWGLYASMDATSFLIKAADPQRLVNWATGRNIQTTVIS